MHIAEIRKVKLDEALRIFENANGADKNSYAFIAGFYSSLIKTLASDKYADFDMVMEVLKRNSK
jgi:hypothetical protein